MFHKAIVRMSHHAREKTVGDKSLKYFEEVLRKLRVTHMWHAATLIVLLITSHHKKTIILTINYG